MMLRGGFSFRLLCEMTKIVVMRIFISFKLLLSIKLQTEKTIMTENRNCRITALHLNYSLQDEECLHTFVNKYILNLRKCKARIRLINQ